MKARRLFHVYAGAAALALNSQVAFAAVTGDQCIEANAKAQPLRRDGKLAAAREQLQICVDPHCPGMVRDDCARRLDELDRLQPTIVFDGKDSAGADLIEVTVTVDGHPLVSRLVGSPLSVDPGAHAFTFEAAGRRAVTRTFVLKEGEKGRIERIVFDDGAVSSTSARPVPPGPVVTALSSSAETAPHGMGTRKAVALAIGGVGVAGVAAGGVFGLLAMTAWNRAKSECPTTANCTQSQHSKAVADRSTTVTYGTVADIGFIAGGVLLAAGTVLFFTGPSAGDARRDHALQWQIAPSLGPASAGIDLRGQF